MTKASLTIEQKQETARLVSEALSYGGKLLITITHSSKSNMSYRYKVALAYTDPIKNRGIPNTPVELAHLSYWIAAETGASINENNEIRGNGCGFDRRHDAAYTVGQILASHGMLPNGVTRGLDVANSQYWVAI